MKMKKFLFLLSFILLPFVTFAQENVGIDNVEEIAVLDVANLDGWNTVDSTNILDADVVSEDVDVVSDEKNDDIQINEISENENVFNDASLEDIRFWFCNDWLEDLTFSFNSAVVQWKPHRICVALYNVNTSNPAFLNVDMVFWELAWDWSDACSMKSMSDFISSWSLWQIEIPPENYITKEFDITYPFWFDWEQKACLTFTTVDRNPENDWWLKFVSRRAYYMTFFVWWWDWIINSLDISDLKVVQNEKKDLILSFLVNNIWNMENSYNISWIMKWWFNYNKEFTALSWRVTPWGSEYVEINLWLLPSYGWKYNIDFTINWTPYFSYDISNLDIDESLFSPKSFSFSSSYFVFPWILLLVVVIFILLLIVLFRKPKQKVVYVQQPQVPQQPVQPQQPQIPQQ